MTISKPPTHLLLLLLLLFPNICFGNDAIEHKNTSVLFYYNAEASISYQDTKGREHRVVSWLPMTLHVSFNNGSFAYKTYPGIVIQINNGSFSNIYRRDLFVNHAYIQSLWIHNRMYFNLLKTACDFARLISKNIGDFNIFEYKNMPAYQFLLEHKLLSVEDKYITMNTRMKLGHIIDDFDDDNDECSDTIVYFSNRIARVPSNFDLNVYRSHVNDIDIASILQSPSDDNDLPNTDSLHSRYAKIVLLNAKRNPSHQTRYTYATPPDFRRHTDNTISPFTLHYAFDGSYIECDEKSPFHNCCPELDKSVIFTEQLQWKDAPSQDDIRATIELSPDKRCRYHFDDQIIQCGKHKLDLFDLIVSKHIFDDNMGQYKISHGALIGIRWLTQNDDIDESKILRHQFIIRD